MLFWKVNICYVKRFPWILFLSFTFLTQKWYLLSGVKQYRCVKTNNFIQSHSLSAVSQSTLEVIVIGSLVSFLPEFSP